MNKVFFGDCRDSLRKMAADGVTVQMCVTSPPYFGLRSYGGGDAEIGKEETPDEFISALVEVFRLVRDVLADDGVLFINIGDSYAANRPGGQPVPTNTGNKAGHYGVAKVPQGCKPKDLIGIPWMLAFALRADGWYLRQEIIWSKPNPMPESVTDRCTKSHESIFLPAKSAKYFYDYEAIKEKGAGRELFGNSRSKGDCEQRQDNGRQDMTPTETRNKRSVWTVATKPYSGAHFATYPTELIEPCILAGSRVGDIVLDPFFGSGTTGQVAQALGRQYIGCELNPAYESLQKERTRQPSLIFEVAA